MSFFSRLFRILFLLVHKCPPIPTGHTLMAVLARIGNNNIWEQWQCDKCQAISHWRRDSLHEPFRPWKSYGTATISDDLSEADIRNPVRNES